MKTTGAKSRDLPRPLRIIVFIFAIATLCLPNWIVLNAGDPLASSSELDTQFALALVETVEPEIDLENWMLCPEDWCSQLASTEPEIPLEEWMLDFTVHPRSLYAPILADQFKE